METSDRESCAPAQREPDRLRAWEYALPAGELGVSACQTLLVAVLPVLIRDQTGSSFGIGFAVGGEGLFALAVPWMVGRAVDRLPHTLARRFGRHSFFMMGAAPIMILALCAMPAVSSYWLAVAAAFVFFVGQHAYQTPLMSLVVNGLPDGRRARVQGVRSIYRACGLSFGLVAGGLLFSVEPALPFVIGSALLALCTAVTRWAEGRACPSGADLEACSARPLSERLRDNRTALWVLLANALWNGAIDGVRPYVFVFAIAVLGLSVSDTSLGMIALVVSLALGSALCGKLGDSYDRMRLLELGALVVIAALAVGYFVRTPSAALLVALAAGFGASALLTLPYIVFARSMGSVSAGEYSGVFVASVSVGRLLAPMLIGACIDLGAVALPALEGYPWMWPPAAALALLGSYALRRARQAAHRSASLQPVWYA
jgi:MFS family permease